MNISDSNLLRSGKIISSLTAIVMLWSSAALAQTVPVGKIVQLEGHATIRRNVNDVALTPGLQDDARQAKLGDRIFEDDFLATGADGKMGIALRDGTAMTLSPSASLTISQFVYNPHKSGSNFGVVDLVGGVFTMIAGKVAKTGELRVTTPAGTLGIRGTTPHIEIRDDGTVRVTTLIEQGMGKLRRRPPACHAAKWLCKD